MDQQRAKLNKVANVALLSGSGQPRGALGICRKKCLSQAPNDIGEDYFAANVLQYC